MFLRTFTALEYGENNQIIEEEDLIKIHLKNGEILIGEYQNSDGDSLLIDRNSDDIHIEFVGIKNIEKIDEEC